MRNTYYKNYQIRIKQKGSIYWIEFRNVSRIFGIRINGMLQYLAEIKNNVFDWTAYQSGAKRYTNFDDAKMDAYRIEWLILQQESVDEIVWESSDEEDTQEKFKAFQKFAIEAGDEVAELYFFKRVLEFDKV